MSTYAQAPALTPLLTAAAQILGRDPDDTRSAAQHCSFVALGGTSLSAVDLVARAERLGLEIELPALLSNDSLAQVLSAARPVPDQVRNRTLTPRADRAATVGESAMLMSEDLGAGHPWRLLFSVDLYGKLDEDALLNAVQTLTDRHEALRTVYFRGPEGLRARVIPQWRARLHVNELELAEGEAGVDTVHAMLGAASPSLLAPFECPPAVFCLTKSGSGRRVLSLLIHHVVADGWSIGLLWRELFSYYQGTGPDAAAPAFSEWPEPDPGTEHIAVRRTGELSDTPTVLELPSDLGRPDVFDGRGARIPVHLAADIRDRCNEVAQVCGVTRNVVLLAAWSLAIARRAGHARLLVGLSWVGRSTSAQQSTVGLGTSMLPVKCEIDGTATVRAYIENVGRDVRAAIGARDVPPKRLATGVGVQADARRNPLVQVGFAAHDEMVPERLDVPGLEVRLHEGHCGGATLDALLYVQRWGEEPRLCVEYASSVISPGEAALLIADFLTVLRQTTENPERRIRTVTAQQSGLLPPSAVTSMPVAVSGADETPHTDTGLWQLIEQVAEQNPDAPAVTLPGRTPLSYAALLRAVEAQSAALYDAGVRTGDCVVIAVPRSAEEIVAVLAAIRLGAAYIGMEPAAPATVIQRVAELARPAAVLARPERAAELSSSGLVTTSVDPLDPWSASDSTAATPSCAAPDPERVAYIAFTSGSTGLPKAVRIPHRAVLRLILDPDVVRPKALGRFLRLAPLSFDASTLELFSPLAAGGSIVVYPNQQPTTAALARFLHDHAVTGLWLTAGLFRLVADHEPEAFSAVDHLLTGGDVVPAAQVRRVLQRCPGLRITNGYGPTENTTFTTVHHLDDAAAVGDAVPIGRPIARTDVLVVDEAGLPVPQGVIGELYASGDGLALDYLNDPAETERSFVVGQDQRRYYRTGDLVRWDGEANLRILGRRDRQVKVRGFRVELEEVAAVLRKLPDVSDAVAVTTTTDGGETRIVAGVIAGRNAVDPLRLRALASEQLPDYAVPSLWAVIERLPVTSNGKVDAAMLTDWALSTSQHTASAPDSDEADTSDEIEELEAIEDRVAEIWEEVLGTIDFGYDDRFFDVGGDSLQIPQVRKHLIAAYPGHEVKLADMFRYATVRQLAAFMHAKVCVA
ncbi:amino acid adenylation domain-containing protein [Streptomyces sp. NBC_00647]|uniref:non-ribosomal peptide synthetase n=1 Tax=Streptomyces sp. NBC_00647 TaxID=2975796 RepID=UPI003250025C